MRTNRLILMCGILALLSPAAFAQNNALFIGDTIPTSMIPGFSYNVTVTMKNTGTTTWTSSSDHRLYCFAGFANGMSVGFEHSDSIGQGQQKTFYTTLVAPSVGSHSISWRMDQYGVGLFGETCTKTIQVAFGPNVPGAPTLVTPTRGVMCDSNRPDIRFIGDPCDSYEVHIGTYNTPNSTDGWDSGTVSFVSGPGGIMAYPGVLNPQTTYYVFVRLHNTNGWGPWSAYGNWFHTIGQVSNDPSVIASSGLEWWSYVVHNPDRNEYLITWENGYTIHWRLLDGNGAMIGTERVVSDGLEGYHYSNACYNSARQEYLLQYDGWDSQTGHVRIQRISATTGDPIGSPVQLYSVGIPSTTGGIRVAYSPTSNSYLATWEAYSEGGGVYGQILNSLAVPTSSVFRINDTSFSSSRNPAIAWNSANNEYMVTYQGSPTGNGWDYLAQRVRASDGTLQGPSLNVSASQGPIGGSVAYGIAYDPDMNRYLAVYPATASSPIGQFISASGALVGSTFGIGGGDYFGWGPSVYYDSSKREFLATWSANLSYNVFARRISQTGSPIGETFSINGTWIGFGNWPPTAAYNSVNDEFLITWYNSYATILTRRYKSFSLPGADTTPPGTVTGLTATPGPSRITLNWTNPSDTDFAGAMIRYKTTGYPTSITDGTLVIDYHGIASASDSLVHTDLDSTRTYYYSVFVYDEVPNYCATVAHDSGSPLPLPGAPVILTPASGSNVTTVTPAITWSSDTHDQYQVRISQLNDANTSVNGWDSGTVASGANSCTSGLLRNMSIYYVFARVHNSGGWGNWSTSGYVFTTRTTTDCVFYPADLAPSGSGWTFYDSGVESGPGLSSSILADGGSNVFKIIDSSTGRQCKEKYTNASALDVNFDTGASIAVRMKATGTIVNPGPNAGICNGGVGGMFISVSATDVKLVEKTGTSRGSYSLDGTAYHKYQLTVKNATTGNNVTAVWKVYVDGVERISWTGAGTDDGSDGYMIGAGYFTATGTWWIDWAAGRNDGAYSPAQWDPTNPDLNAPAAPVVTDDGLYTGSLSRLHCSWSSVSGATQYQYRIGTSAGAGDVLAWTNVGTALELTRTDLSLAEGNTYYFSVQAGTSTTWSESGISNGISAPIGVPIQASKSLANSEARAIRGKTVTAAFAGYFYIQEPLLPYGIKVLSNASVTAGQTVNVAGTMTGAGGERAIDAMNSVIETSPGTAIAPRSISNLALGGADLNTLALGVVDGAGANNLGLLVRCWGKVSNISGTTYQISDGSQVTVTVQAPGPASVPSDGAFTLVEGISTMGSERQRLILAR